MRVSWTIGRRSGRLTEPSWAEIEKHLVALQKHSGAVTLDIVDGPDLGPQSLQVRAERGRFVLTLGEDDGEDYTVRTFANDTADSQRVEVLGDLWDPGLVCDRFEIVLGAFTEFFETGDVSRNILS